VVGFLFRAMTSFELRKNPGLNLFDAGDFLLFCVAQRFKFGAEPLLTLGALLCFDLNCVTRGDLFTYAVLGFRESLQLLILGLP
jgi:hypothetical protein